VLQDCLIVNTFRYCYFPKRQADVAQMLQDRQHKTEDKFDCSEVFAFIVKSVTPDYQKAVQLRYQLCNIPFFVSPRTHLPALRRSAYVLIRPVVCSCVMLCADVRDLPKNSTYVNKFIGSPIGFRVKRFVNKIHIYRVLG
jgi:hypothetical protein